MEEIAKNTPLSRPGKLILSLAFADGANIFRFFHGSFELYFINSKTPEHQFYFENSFEKLNILEIAKMSLDFWASVKERQDDLPFSKQVRYEQAFLNYERITSSKGEVDFFDLDYYGLSALPPFNRIDWEWDWVNFESERKALISAGFREIDLNLYNAACRRNISQALDLLRQGANPYINLDDREPVYQGSLFDYFSFEDVLDDDSLFKNKIIEYYSATRPKLSKEEMEARKDPYWGGIHEFENYLHPALDWNNLFFEEDVIPILSELFKGASGAVVQKMISQNCQIPPPQNPMLPPYFPINQNK